MQCAITDECTVYYDQELRLSQRIQTFLCAPPAILVADLEQAHPLEGVLVQGSELEHRVEALRRRRPRAELGLPNSCTIRRRHFRKV